MEKTQRPDGRDDLDDAVMAADDTGMLASQHLVLEEEIAEHAGSGEAPEQQNGA